MQGRRGAASVWAIALLVLAFSGCSGAATTVTGKTFLQRLGGGVRKLYDRFANRKGNFPGLERKPGTTALTDPENMKSDNPAIKEAAEVKAEEDQAAQKVKALKYLGTVGCGCHPDVRDALFAALDDCNADVRYAGAKAFETAANGVCSACNTKSCCDREVLLKLWKMGYEKRNNSTCWLEPSPRVRSAARAAFHACKKNCLPVPPPSDGPTEGPSAAPQGAEGEGPAAEANAAGASTTRTARSRGVEAAGGVFYVPGARLLAGKSSSQSGAQQGAEVSGAAVPGAPPRPDASNTAYNDPASMDDLNGEPIPPRPDGLGGPPLRSVARTASAPQSSANAPASLDGSTAGANAPAYNNSTAYSPSSPVPPQYRGAPNGAQGYAPPAPNMNGPAQPLSEPLLTPEQLEARRRALQSAVYNQQVEADVMRQVEFEQAKERQALAWKQEQERLEIERLRRMAAQPGANDFGANGAPNAPSAAPNAPTSVTPNGPTNLGGGQGFPATMPTLVAPGGPLTTLPNPQMQLAAQQNPAPAAPRPGLPPSTQQRLEQESAARERMLRDRAAAIEAVRQQQIASQTQPRAGESERDARERWIREHEQAEKAEQERVARLQEGRRQLTESAAPEAAPPGGPGARPAPANEGRPLVPRLGPPPWQQGRIERVDAAGGSLSVVFPKTAPTALVGKQIDVFQRVDGRWALLGNAEVVGVQGEGVVARPVGQLNLQQVTTSDHVFYRVNGSAEPPR